MKQTSRMATMVALYGIILVGSPSSLHATQPKSEGHPFTIVDEIGLAHFGDPYTGQVKPISISPDGKFAAVIIERGLVKENRPDDELRVYSTETLRRDVNDSDHSTVSEPLWVIRKSTYNQGPIITQLHWLPDSSALAFLAKSRTGGEQLWLAEIQQKKLSPLTAEDQDVTGFDVRDRTHFAFTARDPELRQDLIKLRNSPVIVGTGQSIYPLSLYPVDTMPASHLGDRSHLWAARGGKPLPVMDSTTHRPITIYRTGQDALTLSPDGSRVATALAVPIIPKEWETRYPPPAGKEAHRLAAGTQDLNGAIGVGYVSTYAVIDLNSGSITKLTGAPNALVAGWLVSGHTSWSSNGQTVLLPGSFLSDRAGDPPCIVIADAVAKSTQCIAPLMPPGILSISDVRFAPGSGDRMTIEYRSPDPPYEIKTRVLSKTGTGWKADETNAAADDRSPVELTVKQGLNAPPVLIATDRTTHKWRVVWDPNPQLPQINLGEASVYKWKDATGRDWVGGLFKPPDYKSGQRYPLVIQTHGFQENQFRPSGVFPTAFAARALAGAGIMVLQFRDCSLRQTPDEGPCNVRGYESAVKQLASEGLIDPANVGILGFSRTCYYVMEALTTSKLRFKAASVTDGINAGYLQYITGIDWGADSVQRDEEALIGAPPYGAGLRQWIERSPEFNIDKITAPLLSVSLELYLILEMWEPHAMLRHLKKPTDLIIVDSYEHVLTNPGVRLISQGGSVDWFRFWLQGYEDPDPVKAEQYKRWRDLRKLQEENDKQHHADLGFSDPPAGRWRRRFSSSLARGHVSTLDPGLVDFSSLIALAFGTTGGKRTPRSLF